MFRFVVFIALAVFSLSVIAETRLEVTPQRPVNCAQFDHAQVNWVYKINKVSESAEQVTFEFITQYGSCVNGRVVPVLLDERIARVSVIRDGFVMPWHKEGAEASLEQASESELRVTVVFDKTLLFKKKVERTLTMFFEPGASTWYTVQTRNGPQSILWRFTFPWNLMISVDQTTKLTTLKLI